MPLWNFLDLLDDRGLLSLYQHAVVHMLTQKQYHILHVKVLELQQKLSSDKLECCLKTEAQYAVWKLKPNMLSENWSLVLNFATECYCFISVWTCCFISVSYPLSNLPEQKESNALFGTYCNVWSDWTKYVVSEHLAVWVLCLSIYLIFFGGLSVSYLSTWCYFVNFSNEWIWQRLPICFYL
jgi:hypothetical protein